MSITMHAHTLLENCTDTPSTTNTLTKIIKHTLNSRGAPKFIRHSSQYVNRLQSYSHTLTTSNTPQTADTPTEYTKHTRDTAHWIHLTIVYHKQYPPSYTDHIKHTSTPQIRPQSSSDTPIPLIIELFSDARYTCTLTT